MAKKYLDDNGLLYFWQKIVNAFVKKDGGKGLSTNDYTTAEKNKLSGIAEGANKTVVDSALSESSTNPVQNKAVNAALGNKVDKVGGKVLSTNDYTTAEKSKLNGISEGAEVNQNAFSRISVGGTAIEADSKQDTLTLAAGSNVTISLDPTNDKITIASADTTYSTMTQDQAMAGSDTTGRLVSAKVLSAAIANAIAGITQISYEVVSSLPSAGKVGVIYLISHSHGTQDVYDEYIWTGSAFEKIGNTDVDLSGYAKMSDLVAVTNAEIDTVVSG